MPRTTLALALALAAIETRAEATDTTTPPPPEGAPASSIGASLVRLLHPRLAALEAERRELLQALGPLPRLQPGTPPEEIGYHSELFRTPNAAAWVEVDLGAEVPLEAIALVPARASVTWAEGGEAVGYGFPVRFRIEVGGGQRRRTIADRTAEDVPNPGLLPFVVQTPGEKGRFVRVTATKLFVRQREPRRWGFALGELIVLAQGRNAALDRPVTPAAGLEAPPAWSRQNLVDGRSLLGAPLGPAESPGNGYQGIPTTKADTERSLTVDLGASHALDEVRLVPARPTDWADQAGFGFPPRFRVSIADERGGPEVVLADHTAADFPNPRDNPVVIAAGGRRARMIRFVATRLAPRVQTGDAPAFVLALAELEAYAKGKNVAVGAAVEATDSIEGAPFPRWARRFLVDGAASTHVLMEQGPWLAGLDQRRQLERRLGVVSAAVTAATAEAASLSVGLGGLSVFLVGGAGAAALVWQRRARRRQLEALRRQVTSDLHDDVGSNLGTIALLSQVAQREATPAVAADLSDIERLARESAESLRDVVFLTSADPVDLAALTTRVQQLARVLLPGLTVTVGAPDAAAILPLPLEARRHLLLACKEALHNVAKHAAATAVHVRLAVEGATVRLTVEDDGAGFDVAVVRATGQGLPGLRRRAEAVGGTATIDSRPGAGTRIILTVPLEPRGGRSISSS